MKVPPVLHRELRASSRQWGTYWLRVVAGVLMALLLAGAGIGQWLQWGGSVRIPPSVLGGMLLTAFHGVLLGFFGFVAPLVAADALARERREGTLGLLFLTPLREWDVVLGKTAAHVVRTLALWVAVVPFLAIPLLLGGVGPRELLRAVAAECTVLLTGLAAGLMATSRSRTWMGGVGLAAVWMTFLMLGHAAVSIVVFRVTAAVMVPGVEVPLEAWPAIPVGVFFSTVGGIVQGPAFMRMGGGMMGLAIPTWVTRGVDLGLVSVLGLAVLEFVGASVAAAVILGRDRRNEREGRRETGATSAPAEKRGRRRLRRWFSSNPVAWLEMAAVSLRRLRWISVGVVAVLAWVLLADGLDIGAEDEPFLALLPAFLILEALLAAGSFRREIEEGTLEILLVTPLRPALMVSGRYLALVLSFAPAMGLGLLACAFVGTGHWEGFLGYAVCVVSTWLSLPLVGMRSAMRRLHPIVGWGLTVAWGGIAPLAVGGFLTAWMDMMGIAGHPDVHAFLFVMFFVGVQWVGAVWWGRMTVWEMVTRNYQLRAFARIRR